MDRVCPVHPDLAGAGEESSPKAAARMLGRCYLVAQQVVEVQLLGCVPELAQEQVFPIGRPVLRHDLTIEVVKSKIDPLAGPWMPDQRPLNPRTVRRRHQAQVSGK